MRLTCLPLCLLLLAACGAPAPSPTPEPTEAPSASPPASTGPLASPSPLETAALAFDSLKAPETGKVGEPVTIEGAAFLPDGCWGAPAMTLALDAASRVVTVSGTRSRFLDVCPQVIGFEPVSAAFTPTEAGAYRIEGTVYGYQAGDGAPKPFTATVRVN